MDAPPEVAFFTVDGTRLGRYGQEALSEHAQALSEGGGLSPSRLAHDPHFRFGRPPTDVGA